MASKNVNAIKFVENWAGKGDEKQHCHQYWTELLRDVLNSDVSTENVEFEYRVQLGHTSFIDVYLPKARVIIEQKSIDVDLFTPKKQSDGSILTPFEQAKRYNVELPFSKKARWIITCNFKTILIYDMDSDTKGEHPIKIELEELPTKYGELDFLKSFTDKKIIEEQEISIQAGELIGKLYDGLIKQYKEPKADNTLKSLNKLCVRLVFCLYAEDSGLFDRNDNHIFGNYLKDKEPKDIRKALIELFTVLNQKTEERDPYLDDELAKFPYVNGNLFSITDPQNEEIPNFTEELKSLLVEECSESFDWAKISPTIFGAVFESTLNPETRRSGGMHYTSVENIHKVIDPLFLDDLKAEFEEIKQLKQERKIAQECEKFQDKLASLVIFDPACGSGNFLTETYLSLRKLENDLILFRSKGMSTLAVEDFNPVKVQIKQFYGIEINDFACAVATTAMWIAESQMLHETEEIMHREIDFLPLKSNSNIVEGNALRMNWEDVVPKEKLNYIIGNPPFVGYKLQNQEQKNDLDCVMNGGSKTVDYVVGWYYKASQIIKDTKIRVAFVSTNSICQGEQVPIVWKDLIDNYSIQIDFAYTSFVWDSEANIKAHVHVVIIGFSNNKTSYPKIIFFNSSKKYVETINPYLSDSKTVFIEKRKNPISNSEVMIYGSEPREGGYLILSEDDKNQILNESPNLDCCIKRFISSDDLINSKIRYCLWFFNKDVSIARTSKIVMDRLEKCREFRENSKQKQAHASASTPYLFTSCRQPCTDYLAIPIVSSENRKYIPIGYMSKDIIVSNACFSISNASLFTFSVLTSSIHMAWMRTVCGRLKSDYRYSNSIVYNNFPWCTPTDAQKAKIEQTAQGILDARALYPDCSLADLYDELTMPIELRKAHQANDRAVMEAYGFDKNLSEEEIVAKLFDMYAELTKNEK